MKELFSLLKQGNIPALTAAIINAIIFLIKGVTYLFTGNVAMFAETLHSLGDTLNQLFVFIGSALSKKQATTRFPKGFGRIVNIVLLGAVIIVGIMAYETMKEGFEHIFHPHLSTGFWLNLIVLLGCTFLESLGLIKAMREIVCDASVKAKGFKLFPVALKHLKSAKVATKLVFMEDTVATGGGLLAMIAITIAYFTPFYQAEGIASILIGILMFIVVGKVFLDNAGGAIGKSDEVMHLSIGQMIMTDPDVKDIQLLTVIKEGDSFHVDAIIELDNKLTLTEIDIIRTRIEDAVLKVKDVTDVMVTFDEEDNTKNWSHGDGHE